MFLPMHLITKTVSDFFDNRSNPICCRKGRQLGRYLSATEGCLVRTLPENEDIIAPWIDPTTAEKASQLFGKRYSHLITLCRPLKIFFLKL